MATYAIGDIQGCYQQFMKLLKKIDFEPGRDRLILVGDLINRGPNSLSVLQFAIRHESSIDIVLGNHELHLLAVLEGAKSARPVDNFHDVVSAPERETIREWLCSRPLAIHDPELNILVTHAGVYPDWNLEDCLARAREVEQVLQSPVRHEMFAHMFGNKPRRWKESHFGWKRIRFIINALTRMRYIKDNGKLDLAEVGPPGRQQPGRLPWFEFPEREKIDPTIVFGHWSSLGVVQEPGILALDSGCCWGGRLSAARLDCDPYEIISVRCKKSKVRTQVLHAELPSGHLNG